MFLFKLPLTVHRHFKFYFICNLFVIYLFILFEIYFKQRKLALPERTYGKSQMLKRPTNKNLKQLTCNR